MKYTIKIIILTTLLLGCYVMGRKIFGVNPRFAESNYVANQIRLQTLDQADEDIDMVTVGSSLTARLFTGEIEGRKCLNLGLDGSNAIFGSNRLLDSNKKPRCLVIELNTIYLNTEENDHVLREGLESGTNRLARYIPLLRAEYRPVTLLYSILKSYKA